MNGTPTASPDRMPEGDMDCGHIITACPKASPVPTPTGPIVTGPGTIVAVPNAWLDAMPVGDNVTGPGTIVGRPNASCEAMPVGEMTT